jgi:required for meiotic nuclear division protein 1
LGRLKAYLPPNTRSLHDAWWVPSWSANDKEGEVFVFGNGSIVCWGLGETEAERFAQDIIKKSKAEIAPLNEAESEDLEFVTDPTE